MPVIAAASDLVTLSKNDSVLVLIAAGEQAPTLVAALESAGMSVLVSTPQSVAETIRSSAVAGIVMTAAAMRTLDLEALVAAIVDQSPWHPAMIIGVDVEHAELPDALARLGPLTTVVPVGRGTEDALIVSLARAALHAHRKCQQHIEDCEAAESAARQLAETLEARVEQRTAELSLALDRCSIDGRRASESDERNRAVIDMSELILFTADTEGNLVRVDDRFFAITGFPRGVGMSISSGKARVHPEDRERVRAAQSAARETGSRVDYEYRGLIADGTYRWWQFRAMPVVDVDGAILRWNGTLIDIHDRKMAEDRLRESEIRHRASIALSHLVTFTLDSNGELDNIDDRIVELTGLAMPAHLAEAPVAICHPDDLPLLAQFSGDVPESRSHDVTIRIKHANGGYKWWRVRAAARCNTDGKIIGWFGTMEDVDLLVGARERLKASEEAHRFSVELSDQVVFSAAADGTLVSISPAFFHRLGVEPDAWMAMTSAERAHPDDVDRIEAIKATAARDRAAADYRFRLRLGDGSYRWWRTRSAPLLDGDGVVLRWHGVLEDVDELYRAEERLRQSEERYRFAIQMSNLVTYTTGPDGRIATMDDITSAATGFSIEEIVERGSDFTWHPDHVEAIRRARAEAAVTGHYDQTRLMDNRDGTYKWWRSRAAPYRDANGEIVCWHGTLENVDELKRAEARLRESEDRHRFCIGLSKLVTYTATPDGQIESIDEAVFHETGVSVAEIVGGGPTGYCHPEDLPGLEAAVGAARETGALDFSYRMHGANGRYRWWRSRAQPRRDAEGNIIRWYGTLEDIDDLRQAEQRLRDSEDRHRFCIGLSKLITYTTTATGKVLSIDDGIEAATGIPGEDIVGGSPLRGCHPDDIAGLQAAHLASMNDGAFDHSYRLQDPDGGYRWWRSRSQPRYDSTGKIVLRYGTLEDIDDLRRAEERLRDSEELHRFSLKLSDLVVWSATPDGVVKEVGERLFEVAGISREAMFAGRMRDWLHPDDAERMLEQRQRSIADGSAADFVFRMRKADGDYYWWRWRSAPQIGPDGTIVRWYGTLENVDDLRRAEEQLRSSEELHRHSVELSNLVVWTADPRGRFLSISPRIFKILGLTRDSPEKSRPIALVHPDDLGDAATALQLGLGSGKSADLRLRLRVADGSYRWWRVRSSPLRGDDGEIIRWYGTLDDVDELTRAEERLRESEELHRFSVELGNQVVWTGTPEGRLLSIGPRLVEKIGLDAQALVRIGPQKLVHPDDRIIASSARGRAVREGLPADFQCRVMHVDGAYHWWRIRAAPLRGADNAIVRWYGTLEDIDELVRAGERLRETEELYRYTVELGEQIVVTADPDGMITSIGPRWTTLSGLTEEAILGDGIFALLHPDDRAVAAEKWTSRIADGAGADLACRIADTNGDYRWWRLRAAQRRGEGGEIIGWYGTIEDVDAATRAEQKLQQLQAEMVHLSRANAMGAMASTLAHELNQPLAAVVNYIAGCRRLLENVAGPEVERIEGAMRNAENCALRAGEIIRRVRQQVSRSETNRKLTSPGSLIQDACGIAMINARELGIELIVDLDPQALTVHVDAIQIQQVMINLLRNALEAVAGGSTRKIVVSTSLADDYCTFTVDDTGPGVEKTMIARLFEPFETSKASGMGIGLSISRTIVESHGGKIEYSPSALGGAHFAVTLPVRPA